MKFYKTKKSPGKSRGNLKFSFRHPEQREGSSKILRLLRAARNDESVN